jgi:dienelactone hydrolase
VSDASLASDAPTSGPALVPMQRPPEELRAISLSKDSPRDNHERWARQSIEGSRTNAGSEIIAWNVSNPTLSVFEPADPSHPHGALVVLPGGSFNGLAIEREGYSVGLWLAKQGITAFVLKYRVAPMPDNPAEFLAAASKGPQLAWHHRPGPACAQLQGTTMSAYAAGREDAIHALGYVRQSAPQWHVLRDRVGVIGFSAGGIIVSSLSAALPESARPNLIAVIYGAALCNEKTEPRPPPLFIAAASDDTEIPLDATLSLMRSRHAFDGHVELHMFGSGGHGFGVMRQSARSDNWMDEFITWLQSNGFPGAEL